VPIGVPSHRVPLQARRRDRLGAVGLRSGRSERSEVILIVSLVSTLVSASLNSPALKQ